VPVTGSGLGAFGAGFAKSIAGAYADKRSREREEARHQEERQDRLRQALLPTLLENVEDPADLEPYLQSSMPDVFGGRSGKKKRGTITSAIGQYMQRGLLGKKKTDEQIPTTAASAQGAAAAPAQATGAGKVVMTDLDTGAPVGEAPATGQRTLMGVPIMSPDQKIERGISTLETETDAKVALAQRILPKLKAVDPTATMDDALAVVGIKTPSASARSAAAMRPQSVRGTINGQPAFGIFDPTTRSYIDPDTQQPLKGFRPLTNQDTMTVGVDREAIALDLFDKPFAKLSTQQRDIVMREEKTMLQKEAESRTLGAGQGRFQTPIDIKTAQETGVPTGTTAAQVAGQVVPTQQVLETRRSVEQLKLGLEDIRDNKLKALPKANELGGLAPGAAYAVRRRLPQYRNDIATLESAINNIVNVMARSVGQQRGTQTERDALRAEAAIAQIRDAFLTGDTQESATARITESLAVLDRIMQQLPQPVAPTGGPAGAPGAAPVTGAPTVTPVQPVGVPPQTPAQPMGGPRKFTKDANGNWVAP